MVPQSYYDYARSRESGGNAFAKNPRSSATGLYQFTDGTWGDVARKHPDLGLTPEGRLDPKQQDAAMRAFTEDNAGSLQGAGYDPSNTNLYLAHRFGSGGALQLLKSDPNADVASIVTPAVMRANPDLNGKTVAQLTGGASPGALSMPTQTTLVPAQRSVNGVSPTPGALSADSMMGAGALGGEGSALDVGSNTAQQMGAWLMAIDHPQALGALSALGPKPGRYQTQYDAKTGRILTIDSQTGRSVATQDPNFDPSREAREKYDATTAEGFAKKNQELAQAGQEASTNMGVLDRVKQLVQDPNVSQGFGGEYRQTAKNFAKSLGADVSGVAEGQELQSLSNGLSLQSRKLQGGMPGSLSDKDVAFLQKMVPNLGNDQQANLRIVDNITRLHQRAVDLDKLRQAYVGQHGRLDEGFNGLASQYNQQHPLFADQYDAQPASAGTSTPANSGFKVIKVH